MHKLAYHHGAFFGHYKELTVVYGNLNVDDGAVKQVQFAVGVGRLDGIVLEKLRPSDKIQDTIGSTQEKYVDVSTKFEGGD